jgi:hypothetical protein
MRTALQRSLVALGVGLAALVATLVAGVSEALAGPIYPYAYAPKSSWSNVSLASVIGIVAAVTVLTLLVVVSALRTRPQASPVLAKVTAMTNAAANRSGETRKAA